MSQQVSSLHTRKSKNLKASLLIPAPVYLAVGSVLFLRLSAVICVIVLTTLAIVYHLLDRFVARRIPACARFGPALDRCVLVIACLVPFISSPFLPHLLLPGAPPPVIIFPRPFLSLPLLGWDTLIEVGAIAICTALTISSSLISWQVRRYRTVQGISGRPWLLFAGGLQLFWGNGLLMYSLYPLVRTPLWSFLSLTLILLALAVELRRFGTRWAQPLEALALFSTTITLILCLYQGELLWMLLFFFATIAYIIIIYQRISSAIFMPFLLALLALPPLLIGSHLQIIGLLSFLVPVVGVGLHLLLFRRWTRHAPPGEPIWEWPLLSFGIACTSIICLVDAFMTVMYGYNSVFFSTVIGQMTSLAIPFALELAIFAVFWYAISILARARSLLTTTTIFALCALLAFQPLPNGPLLSIIATLIATLLAPAVTALVSRNWSFPLYAFSLLGIIILQFNNPDTDTLLFSALAQAVAVIAWLSEGYGKGERIFIALAQTLIVLILLRGLAYPPFLMLALLLGLVSLTAHILGRRRFQII